MTGQKGKIKMGKRRKNKEIPKYDKGINNSCYPAKEQSRKQSEDVSFTIGEVSSDAAAAEILANVCTHRSGEHMVLSKAGAGMSYAEKYRIMREEIMGK